MSAAHIRRPARIGSVALAAYLLMYVLYTVIVQHSRGMRHWENTCPGVARVPGLRGCAASRLGEVVFAASLPK